MIELNESPVKVKIIHGPHAIGAGERRRNFGARYEPLNVMLGGSGNETVNKGTMADGSRFSVGTTDANDEQDKQAQEDRAWEGKCIHIVIELAECGDVQKLLQNQLKKRMYIAERDLWNFAYQICMGLLHLHTRGVIHRDIKCMNLLLTDNGKTVKLGDMSESRVLDHHSYIKTKKIIGTPLSLSPEVVKHEGYD